MDFLYPPPNCGLERTSRFRRWHRPSKDLFRGVVSGVWRFFFVRATIVASLDGKQDVQCSKVHPLAAGEELNRRHARALSVSFDHPRSLTWTSPQLTTSAFLESSSLCHCVLCECHNKAGVGTNVDIRSSNSFLVQRICLHSDTHRQSHWKGSNDHTADSFSESPMLSTTRSPQASFGRRAEPNTRIKNRYRYSCRC